MTFKLLNKALRVTWLVMVRDPSLISEQQMIRGFSVCSILRRTQQTRVICCSTQIRLWTGDACCDLAPCDAPLITN